MLEMENMTWQIIWCNILQVAPPRLRFDDSKRVEVFAAELAKAAGASVLSIEYSDTADAASVLRIEPNGTKSRDKVGHARSRSSGALLRLCVFASLR